MATFTLDEILGAQQPTQQGGAKPTVPGYQTIGLDELLPVTAGGMQGTPSPAPFKRGLLTTGSDLYNAVGMALGAVGAQDSANSFYTKARQWQETRDAIPRRVPDVESIQGPGDLVTFAYETLAENAPTLATLLLGAGVGAIGARALGAAPAIIKGAGEVAGFLTDLGLQTGESAETAQQAGKSPQDIRVLGAGLGKAMLDFIPFFVLAKQIGLAPVIERSFLGQLAEGGFLKRAAGNAAALVATEVPTEVAQQYLDIALDNSLKDYNGPITPDQISQLKNAAAGAATFGLLGIPAAIGKPDVRSEQPPTLPLDKPPQLALPAPEPSNVFTVSGGGETVRMTEAQAAGLDATRRVFNDQGAVDQSISTRHPASSMFNPRTGELTTPVEDYKRLLIEDKRTIQYDPFQDNVSRQPSTYSPRLLKPGWTGTPDGNTFLLNATDDGAEAVVTRSDEINLEGRSGYMWNVSTPYGVPLGTYEDIAGAQHEGERFAREGNSSIVFRPTEPAEYFKTPDHWKFVERILGIPGDSRTPLENAIVGIDAQKASAQDGSSVDVRIDPELRQAQIHPSFRPLMELRDEINSDPQFRRSHDGQMTKAGIRALGNLDIRINKLAEKLGIPSPVPQDISASFDKGKDLESHLVDVKNQEAGVAQGSRYRNLSAPEASLLKSLEEKELVEGLSDKEYQSLEKLTAKRDGELTPERRRQTPQEKAEILALMAARQQGLLKERDVIDLEAERKRRKEGSTFGVSDSQVDAMLAEERSRLQQQRQFQQSQRLEERRRQNLAREKRDRQIREASRDYRSTEPTVSPEWAEDRETGDIVLLPSKQAPMAWAVGGVQLGENGEFIGHVRKDNDWQVVGEFNSVDEATAAVESQVKFKRVLPRYRGVSIAAIRDAVLPMWQKIPEALRPRVIITTRDDQRHFPKGSALADKASNAAGLYTPGKVYILADGHSSVEEAQKTFLHEVFVHHGLSVYLDPQELQSFLRLVYQARSRELGSQGTEALNLVEAEEYVARLAEERYTGNLQEPYAVSLLDRVIALVKRALRRVVSLKFSDREILVMLSDTAKFLTTESNPNTRGDLLNPGPHQGLRSEGLQKVIGRNNAAEAVSGLDSFAQIWGSKLAGMFLTPLQMAERFSTPGARSYVEHVQRWWARKRDLTSDAVDIAEEWQGLPKRETNRLAEALFKITKESEEKGRRLTVEELQRVFHSLDLGDAAQAAFARIDKSFVDILDKLQNGLEFAALRTIAPSRDVAVQLHQTWKRDKEAFKTQVASDLKDFAIVSRLLEIQQEIDGLRQRNYFPYSRFGRYALTVRAKKDLVRDGKEFKGPSEGRRGSVVAFETFDSYAARDSRINEIVHEYNSRDYHVQANLLSDQEFTFLSMPPALFQELQGKLNLTQAQQDLLRELYLVKSPGNKYLSHLAHRNGTAGFSQDALRVYASYMMNAANHLARVEFHQDMETSLTELRNSATEQGDVAGVVRDYFGKHFDYIMNPKNDWSQLRSLGFMWYLGFNVKSALVNLTQVPMVAFPYLSSIHGILKSQAALMDSYRTVAQWRLGKTLLDPSLDENIKRGIAEGFLDESRATELAGLGEADALERILPLTKNGKLLAKTSYYASYLFRHAEKFNREVTFIAARKLALEAGMSQEDAFLAGKKAVQTTMFEYSKWNRPEFMRGKKSVFFLFWNYMQHLSYLAFGGNGFKTASRIWLMLLLAAGLQGLPFAEDFLDLIDWSGTQVREAVGSPDPKLDLRRDLRELAQTLTDSPDLIMHGLSRYYGLGGLHALELLGIPVPNTDVSGSLSAGRVLPGMETLTSSEPDPDKRLGQSLVDMLGPVAGVGYAFARTLADSNPDEWKRWERAMPSAMKSASQALRRGTRGAEEFRGGGSIVKFDPNDSEQRLETVVNALGFAPTRLRQVQELRSSQEDLRQYWTTRRALVIENYAFAVLSNDQEVLSDARDKLRKFNESAPATKLRVTSETIRRSLAQRTKLRQLRDSGLPPAKAFVPLYTALAESYPEAEASLPNPGRAQ